MKLQHAMRTRISSHLSFRGLALWFCIGLLSVGSACGSRQGTPTRLPTLEETVALPEDAEALRAWMKDAPTSAEGVFLKAHAHMLDVDVEAMHAALLSPLFDDAAPMLRVGRMALLLANSDALIDKAPLHVWMSTRDVAKMVPQERVLFTELLQTLTLEVLDKEDAERLPSALPLGGAARWNVMGPIATTWSEEILEQGDAARVQSLEELSLRGRQRLHVYPTVLGRLEQNPQPDGPAYYESFVRVEEPTRVAVTRFGARDFYSVWIDDMRVMQRRAEDTHSASYQMPVYDLSPGVYRVLMSVRSNAQTVQPPHIIALNGEIAEFSSDAGPARDGKIVRVKQIAPDLTSSLATGEDEAVLTWLVHAAVAMLGDDALAYQLVHMDVGEQHPAVELVRARLLDVVRDMPISGSLALQILRGVPDSWGEILGVSLKESQIVFRTSEDLDAARTLAEMAQTENAPPHVRSVFAHTMRQLRFNALAFTTLKQLTVDYPNWCNAWEEYLHLALSYRGVLDAEDFSNAPMDCQQVRWLKNVVTEQWRGDNVEYTEAQRRAFARRAYPRASAIDLFWHLLQADGPEAAEAHLDTLQNYGLQEADLIAERATIALLREGNVGLEETLKRFVQEHPDREDTQMVLARLSGLPVVEDLRVDGRSALKAYQESERFKQSKPDLVYVLDYAGWHILENGGVLNVTHQMFELNSNDAIRDAGELALPHDSETLELRVIKPDGSVRTPERSSGKSALSMPNLEIGDVLEIEVLSFEPEPMVEQSHVTSGPFYFQVRHAPMVLSQMKINYPQEWANDVLVETFNYEGEHEKTQKDGRIQEVLTVRNSKSIRDEYWTPGIQEYGPWAQFHAYANLETELKRFTDHVLPQVAPSPDIDALTATVIGKAKKDKEKLRAIFRYVVDEMEQAGGFFSVNARQSARMKQGSRLSLLYAMLESAGFSPQLAFIASYDMPQYQSEVVETDQFDAVALYVETKQSEHWLHLTREIAPFDRLPTYAQGRPALIVTGARAGEILETPERLWKDVREQTDAEIWLDAQGNARLEITLTTGSSGGASWRANLEHMPNNDERRHAMEGVLSQTYGQVTLTDLEFVGEHAPDDAFSIRIKATIKDFADASQDTLTIDRMFDELAMLTSATASSTRYLPMSIDKPVYDVLRVRIHPPAKYRVARGLSAVAFEHDEDAYVRTIDESADQSIGWTRSLKVQRKRLEPDAYPPFAKFGQKARNAERVRMQWQRK